MATFAHFVLCRVVSGAPKAACCLCLGSDWRVHMTGLKVVMWLKGLDCLCRRYTKRRAVLFFIQIPFVLYEYHCLWGSMCNSYNAVLAYSKQNLLVGFKTCTRDSIVLEVLLILHSKAYFMCKLWVVVFQMPSILLLNQLHGAILCK